MKSFLNAPKYSLRVLRQSSEFTISAEIILSILILSISTLAQGVSSNLLGQSKRVVIAASAVLDGKGHVLHDTRIVIEGSQIAAIDPKAGPVDYDLRGLTVLPGWIDAHVHITWSFGAEGKNAGPAGTTQEAAYAAACECMADLEGGVYHRPERRVAYRCPVARCHREGFTSRSAYPDGS